MCKQIIANGGHGSQGHVIIHMGPFVLAFFDLTLQDTDELVSSNSAWKT